MRILIIGATGTIGSAVATAMIARGHEVISASRKLAPDLDVSQDASVASFLDSKGPLDAVICTFGSTSFRPVSEFSAGDIEAGVARKAISQIRVALAAASRISDGGSITVTSGVLAREPIRTGAASAAANGALEAFVRAAATGLERGVRMNAVSPSVVDASVAYHASFPGFPQDRLEDVVDCYIRSVENVDTGRVFIPGGGS